MELAESVIRGGLVSQAGKCVGVKTANLGCRCLDCLGNVDPDLELAGSTALGVDDNQTVGTFHTIDGL